MARPLPLRKRSHPAVCTGLSVISAPTISSASPGEHHTSGFRRDDTRGSGPLRMYGLRRRGSPARSLSLNPEAHLQTVEKRLPLGSYAASRTGLREDLLRRPGITAPAGGGQAEAVGGLNRPPQRGAPPSVGLAG